MTCIERELLRSQSGLNVRWSEGRPEMPAPILSRKAQLAGKRAIDIVGAAAGLVFIAPLLLVVAALIKLSDRGPVFFRQTRLGLEGRSFEILKFRSMYVDQCDVTGIAQAAPADSRITPIGAFIRRASIDELPQLINVLVGDMSLVGPRPHVAGMLAAGARYEDLVPHYGFRHTMRPGLTGWAQAHGLRGPTIKRSTSLRRIGHDFAYVQNFSLWLDVRILTKTIASELFSTRAH